MSTSEPKTLDDLSSTKPLPAKYYETDEILKLVPQERQDAFVLKLCNEIPKGYTMGIARMGHMKISFIFTKTKSEKTLEVDIINTNDSVWMYKLMKRNGYL